MVIKKTYDWEKAATSLSQTIEVEFLAIISFTKRLVVWALLDRGEERILLDVN